MGNTIVYTIPSDEPAAYVSSDGADVTREETPTPMGGLRATDNCVSFDAAAFQMLTASSSSDSSSETTQNVVIDKLSRLELSAGNAHTETDLATFEAEYQTILDAINIAGFGAEQAHGLRNYAHKARAVAHLHVAHEGVLGATADFNNGDVASARTKFQQAQAYYAQFVSEASFIKNLTNIDSELTVDVTTLHAKYTSDVFNYYSR